MFCGSKLNVGSFINAMNTSAVSVVFYNEFIVDWPMRELVSMDRRTKKIE